MFSKKVKYTDIFSNEEKEETLYFNLTQKELMDFSTRLKVDNLKEYIAIVQENQDKREMYNLFNALVLASYGKRTNAGGFIKKDTDGTPFAFEFESSEAYSVFMMDIFADETGKLVNEFIEKVIPAEVVAKAEAEMNRIAASGQNNA